MRILPMVFIVLLTVVVVLALWMIPVWQRKAVKGVSAPKELAELEDKFRGTIAQILGGAGLIVGLFFTWQNLTLTQATTETNLRIAEDTLRTSQQQRIAERFARAVDQLGNEKVEVRMGGIFALERIARDSDKDYPTIIELLTAFVRQNAPWRDEEKERLPSEPRSDVQAALTVLGRRARAYGRGEDIPLYLADTNLRGAHLEGAHLEGAILWNAHLEGSVLWGANLSGAKLTVADLEDANLIEVDLDKALLSNTDLKGADLSGASLQECYAVGSTFNGALLSGSHLDGANLNATDLREASLGETAEHPLLHRAFSAASLSGASLSEANLSGTGLEGVDLSDVKGLTQAQVKLARVDAKTRLPQLFVKRNLP